MTPRLSGPPAHGPTGPRVVCPRSAGAQRGCGEGGGGKRVKAEEGVPESKQHMPGAVPCSWRRVGPPGGPPRLSPVVGGC